MPRKPEKHLPGFTRYWFVADQTGRSQTWVAGWLTQFFLLICCALALWRGLSHQATIFVVGSLVIGAVRQIERQRRTRGTDVQAPADANAAQKPPRFGAMGEFLGPFPSAPPPKPQGTPPPPAPSR